MTMEHPVSRESVTMQIAQRLLGQRSKVRHKGSIAHDAKFTEDGRRLCKCGRGPWRNGQRNCRMCNREAVEKCLNLAQAPGTKSANSNSENFQTRIIAPVAMALMAKYDPDMMDIPAPSTWEKHKADWEEMAKTAIDAIVAAISRGT